MDYPVHMASDSKSELRAFVGAWKVASERHSRTGPRDWSTSRGYCFVARVA